MEVIVIIAIIGFIIWIFSGSNSSSNKTQKTNNSSTATTQQSNDYYIELKKKQEQEAIQKELKRKQEQEVIQREKEKVRKEKEERESRERDAKIRQEQINREKSERVKRIHNQDKDNEKEQILNNYGINYFYHMTHKDNLRSILTNGLYSHNLAHRLGLNNQDIANNDVIQIRASKRDTINNLYINDYAPLYINPKNPMLFVRREIEKDLVIIAFDRSLIYYPNSIFTDGNAANRPTRFFNSLNDLNNLNWNCLNANYWNDFNDGTRLRMSEVLVKEKIPNTKIRKLFCCSPDTLSYVNGLITNYEFITADINSKYFFKTYQSVTNNFISNFDDEIDDLPF